MSLSSLRITEAGARRLMRPSAFTRLVSIFLFYLVLAICGGFLVLTWYGLSGPLQQPMFVALISVIAVILLLGKRLRTSDRARPAAEFLFYLFLDKQNCDAIIGDLEERYKLIQKRFGTPRANFWYWTQAVRSVGPIASAWAMKPLVALLTWILAKGLLGRNSWLSKPAESLLDWHRKILVKM